jgi:hypothetical protein
MSHDATAAMNFADGRQCLSLLAGLPLTRLDQVHDTLASLFAGMRATPPSPAAYLEVLEMARPSAAFVQEEMAAHYSQTALPPSGVEDATLRRVVALWQAMAGAYAHVAQLGGESPEVQSRLALICQRCIHYSGNALQEYLRARRDVATTLWSDLHGYYSTAEEWGIAQVEVAETLLGGDHRQSCSQAYAAVLLMDLGNPYGRSAREFSWLKRWSQTFASHTDIVPLDAAAETGTYVVDLLEDCGLAPLESPPQGAQAREHLRHLVTTRLSKAIRRVLGQLKHRVPAAQLGLGDDCLGPPCSRLLASLYRRWCLAAHPRRHPRRRAKGTARLCYGFEAIHYHVAGAEFVQPEHVHVYSRNELETLLTFRHPLDPIQPLHVRAAQIGYTVETWAVADESIAGFRLLRLGAGVHIEYGQLVGIEPTDSKRFLLCQISWLMYLASGVLMVGVHVLPGVPQPIAVRQTGIGVAQTDKYSRAFLLPALPLLQQEATLVLPKGWFAAGRVVEMCTDRRIEVRLIDAPNQGVDFDRVGFTVLREVSSISAPHVVAESAP